MFYGFFYTTTFKIIGKETINDDQYLTLIGAVSSLATGVCRFMFAVSLDYISFKRCFGTLTLIYLVCIMLMRTSTQSRAGFLIVSVLSFSLDGAISSMVPVLIFKIYGTVMGPKVYTYIYSVYFTGNFMFILIMQHLGDESNYD